MSPEPFAINLNSGTIANTGTFQTALASNGIRKGALIVNTSTNTLEAVFTPAASATAAVAIPIAPGGTLNANPGGVYQGVYQGEIAINGTSADAYVTWEFTRE